MNLMRVYQIGVALLCILSVGVFIQSLPDYYDILRSECVFEACELAPAPPTTPEELSKLQLSPDLYALIFVLIDCLLVLSFYIAAGIIFWKCFREPMGLLGVSMLVTFGSSFTSVLTLASDGQSVLFMLGWCSFIMFYSLFPNGRFFPKWISGVAITFVLLQVLSYLSRDSLFYVLGWPIWLKGIFFAIPLVAIGFSQIYRFLRVQNAIERQQSKWVVYGFAVSIAGFIGVSVLFNPSILQGALTYVYLNLAINLCLIIIPVTLTIAVLRHRLWDIDPLVNRTIVYAALSVSIIAVYIVSVTYLSRVFQTDNNLFVSLAATTVVAVLFAPLKERLHRIVNRMMYGKKDDPFTVLAELSAQWMKPMEPNETIRLVVQTVRDSLHLPYAGITFTLDEQETLMSSSGELISDTLSLPIVHRGEELGFLIVAHRSQGEAFTVEDRKLLNVLIRHVASIVQGVKMSVELKLLARDLQESREKLILAREEERRKLRDNLHDDLAPRLAALALNVAAAERYVKKDPEKATSMLTDLGNNIRGSVMDIRTIVHGLRPPTLDELGLIGAIQEKIHELTKSGEQAPDTAESPALRISLDVNGDLPAFPAAVEVAAYRIITESIVNVVRHSQATNCTVHIAIKGNRRLSIEIVDDGIGINSRRKPHSSGGIGIQSIRERAAELGGQVNYESPASGGTKVIVVLPYEPDIERSSESADINRG